MLKVACRKTGAQKIRRNHSSKPSFVQRVVWNKVLWASRVSYHGYELDVERWILVLCQ